MMRVLALSGGGFKGAFQVSIIEELTTKHKYDLILGVSVGSINGALAAQGDLHLMRQFWEDIDCKNPMFGVPGFLSLAVHKGRGIYSLKPVQKKLEEHVSLSKLKVPFGAGTVARETGEYYTMLSSRLKNDKDLHNSILASSAIAGLMEPVVMKVNASSGPLICSDGGHRYVLPVIPSEATHIDAVFCNPLEVDTHKTAQVDRLFEAIAWAADIQMEAHILSDVERLHIAHDHGAKVTIYSPRENFGGLLKADQETLQKRMKEGEYALKHPWVL